jgi:hypothetical protein
VFLFHSILDLGDGGAGAFFIKVTARSPTDADPSYGVSADHDCHAGTALGGFLLIRSATALVLSSFRASVSDAAE